MGEGGFRMGGGGGGECKSGVLSAVGRNYCVDVSASLHRKAAVVSLHPAQEVRVGVVGIRGGGGRGGGGGVAGLGGRGCEGREGASVRVGG